MTISSPSERRCAGARIGTTIENRRASMIRIDHAGERAAVRIYEAQKAVLEAAPPDPKRNILLTLTCEMLEQERHHLALMNQWINEYKIRPTILDPIWAPAAHILGSMTMRLGPEAALACTEAVEIVIASHYREQAAELHENDPGFAAKCLTLAEEEEAHQHTAQQHGAEQAPGYKILLAVIGTGCRIAIALSKRF